jgi:hypothetical protein
VLVINFRPAAVPPQWSNSDDLAREYVSTMRVASGNTLAYQIVDKKTVADYPILEDGRRYTDSAWTMAMQNDQQAYRDTRGRYMMADYNRIFQDFNVLAQIRDKVIDEVWLFGGPLYGFYESRMAGRGAFWCNAPAIELTGRLFVVMGFNFERGSREMVHNFGHRTESILGAKFGSTGFLNQLYFPSATPLPAPANEFEQFLVQHGTTHRIPGGADYSQDEIAWATALKPEWWPPVVNPNLFH